ncbi:Acyl-homoserine lactone (AHL) acylase PvdQ [Parapedobacter composti]|uniref:Acyl-homoserine lactone (AHL) acylase PvdQ n=1 Tax=Parapedobacter composti TaxID=623281 RepID=A0A1I1GEP3_9SPHI|nr:penicillin acylase family protein [Parapedobacter composti]SFC10219.1 Acyl-homoserine lactone (AHL) acylase PvdQ [Parapedobacter composti]
MRKHLHGFLLLLFCLPGAWQQGQAQHMATKPDPSPILQAIMHQYQAVGLAVAVVKDGNIIYNQSFGWKDADKRLPLSNDDVFRIASISKSFSATAIMQLVEAGKLTLDDDVSELIGFTVRNPRYPDAVITLRMLLSHTSSLNDSQTYHSLDVVNPAANPDWQKCYSRYRPGERYRYCNLNYNMVGTIIERVSGERFDRYIKRHILDPLGLYGGYCIDSLDARRFANIYRYNAKEGRFSHSEAAYARQSDELERYVMGYSAPIFSPTGGMKISARDLARYMIMHMNLGHVGQTEIMTRASSEAMQRPVAADIPYGYAIRTTDELIKGKTLKGHTGSAHGLYSTMFFDPEENFGIVAMTNGCRHETINGFDALLWSTVNCLYTHFIGENNDLADQVVVRRTSYGIPHIKADNLRAAGYAMGFVQLEDYGRRVVNGLVRARGEWGRYHQAKAEEQDGQIDRDAANKLKYSRAATTYHRLGADTRDVLEGFAAGVNRYIELHPDEFPSWVKPDFTGYDVHALGIGSYSESTVKAFIRAHRRKQDTANIHSGAGEHSVWANLAVVAPDPHPDEGSNTWAFAPSRTTGGNAILMRNPHLSWDAGYYEAHVEVPGKLNFYGDFRIGGPLGIICGFNADLGWSTTNNAPDTDEIYAVHVDPEDPNRYLLDGESHILEEKSVAVTVKSGTALDTATRKFHYTSFGPVIYRDDKHIYVMKAAGDGEYRTGEQFLRLMLARNLEEWKEAMRIHSKTTSNFTYADRDGNIFYVWNAMVPALPLPSGGDTTAVLVTASNQVWNALIPWDDLPQLHNPETGYLHNENDPFHFTNLEEPFDAADFPEHFPEPRLRLRSQRGVQLVMGNDKRSLEDIIVQKHDARLLLADRVTTDLIAAVRRTKPKGDIAKAIKLIAKWDHTANHDSRGGVLFETWWDRYVTLVNGGKQVASTPASAGYPAPADSLFSTPWSPENPITTPYGLASPQKAAEAFEWAVEQCKTRYGAWNLPWGDVYRARIGDNEIPISGAPGELGCFRVLWFRPHETDKTKREVRGGDGWVLAVEFGETPRAMSVLAYGQSNKSGSPHASDQLELFARGELKPVAFTEAEIQAQLLRTYRPGKDFL